MVVDTPSTADQRLTMLGGNNHGSKGKDYLCPTDGRAALPVLTLKGNQQLQQLK